VISSVCCESNSLQSFWQVAKEELSLECDYTYEAQCQQRFKALIEAEPAFVGRFSVPGVVPELCAQRLLTTERVPGMPIDQVCSHLSSGVHVLA
jgi:predicted unusual protein kinase regulating ubiquinone biosynthesis (AarF/ABC1/UbiB family)